MSGACYQFEASSNNRVSQIFDGVDVLGEALVVNHENSIVVGCLHCNGERGDIIKYSAEEDEDGEAEGSSRYSDEETNSESFDREREKIKKGIATRPYLGSSIISGKTVYLYKNNSN